MAARAGTAARVPPHSIEAEQAVLGGLMLSPDAFPLVMDLIAECDFYRSDHRLIYRAIADLADRRQPADAVTLGSWLESNGLAQAIGGTSYLIDLANTTPSWANVRAYAQIVREKSIARQLIEAGAETVAEAYEPNGRSAIDLVSAAQARIGRLLRAQPSELERPGPILKRIIQRASDFMESGRRVGLSTGFDELDRILGYLKGGQLIVIASRPKMGKTTMARLISEHVACDLDLPVAFHTLEVPPEDLLTAACCSLGSVPFEHVRRWDLEDHEWAAFTKASARLKDAPLLVSRPRDVRVEVIIAQTMRAHAERKLALVVIDYLQLIQTVGDNRAQALGEVTRALKMMALELDVPVILLSQVNRAVEARQDKRPSPADLRDSGTIEQDADAIVFIYRDEVYNRNSPDRGTAEIIVSMQRSGPPGMARVQSRLDLCRFEPLPPGWMPDIPDEPEQAPRGFRRRTRQSPTDGRARAAGEAKQA